MIINTKQVLMDLQGNPMMDGGMEITLGNAIARQLVSEQSSDPLKAYSLAQKFHSQEEVDLDAGDTSFLRDAVKKTKVWFPIVTGQILIQLENIKTK